MLIVTEHLDSSKVGGHVFLKVRAKKSSLRFGNHKKLAAIYYGPFEVLKRIGF